MRAVFFFFFCGHYLCHNWLGVQVVLAYLNDILGVD